MNFLWVSIENSLGIFLTYKNEVPYKRQKRMEGREGVGEEVGGGVNHTSFALLGKQYNYLLWVLTLQPETNKV